MLGMTPPDTAAIEQQQWRRWGGIAALAVAVGYAAIIPVFAWVGPPPTSGQAWFHYLPGKITAWWAIVWLSVFTDLCYLPVAWALYLGLRDTGQGLMRAASLLLHLFVVLDLCVTWTHHASILALYQRYAAESDAAQRAAWLAASEYAASIYSTPLLTFYIIVIPSAGVLLASITMLKAGFGKASAWIGVITGLFGLLSLTGFFPLVMANALGATLWFFLLGPQLLRRRNTQTSSVG